MATYPSLPVRPGPVNDRGQGGQVPPRPGSVNGRGQGPPRPGSVNAHGQLIGPFGNPVVEDLAAFKFCADCVKLVCTVIICLPVCYMGWGFVILIHNLTRDVPVSTYIPTVLQGEESFLALGERTFYCGNTWMKRPSTVEALQNLDLDPATIWIPLQGSWKPSGLFGRQYEETRAGATQARKLLNSVFEDARSNGTIPDHLWYGTGLGELSRKLLSENSSFSSNSSVVDVMHASSLTADMLLQHARQSRPVIIKDGLWYTGWNRSRWADEEISARYGEVMMRAAAMLPDGSVSSTSRMSVSSFMEQSSGDVYARRLPIACIFHEELLSLPVPGPIASGAFSLTTEGPIMYWGAGVSKLYMHLDASDNFYTVIEGAKFMRLFDREDVRLDKVPWTKSGMSAVPDPIFSNRSLEITATPVDVVVNAGDVLFLPAGWAHFTISASEGSHKAIAVWVNSTTSLRSLYSSWPEVHRDIGQSTQREARTAGAEEEL